MNSVFLAASMKSGSTHVKNTLHRMGLRPASVHAGVAGCVNEDSSVDMSLAAALFPMGGFVFQHHMRAIGSNVAILDMFNVKPIVMVRNVFDSVVSWKESMDKDVLDGKGNYNSHSSVYGAEWNTMNEHEKYQWIVFNVVPWYFSFYLSWKNAQIDTHFVWYETYYQDQVTGLKKILEHSEIDEGGSNGYLDSITSAFDGKFNVGKVGRGALLSREHRNLIRTQAQSWGPREGLLLEEDLCNQH